MTARQKNRRGVCAMSLLGVALFAFSAHGQNDLDLPGLTREQEQELEYADRLLASGLADYSRRLLERMNLPAEIMDIRKIRSFTAIGDFAKAEALVRASQGNSQAVLTLRLTLADGYYAWGQYDKAQALYDDFFKRFPGGPEPALKPFYLSSAYKYAQMMMLTGNLKAAADAYRMALKTDPERHIKRLLQSELAEVLLRVAETESGPARMAGFDEIQKIVDDILWVQDVWFGRGIVMMAHMRMIEGDVDGAMALVDDYTPQLTGIDRALREESASTGEDLTKLSPMAQCRYMIGVIMHNEANRLIEQGGDPEKALGLLIGKEIAGGGRDRVRRTSGALQHFLNVFVRYPNTSWAPDAGNRFRQVEDILDRVFGRQVQARISPEQWAEVETAQFREARALFNQQRFQEAAATYEQVLSLFPERATSVAALGELAACYIESEEFNMADTVLRHLAERFNRNPELSAAAGDQVIRVAFKYSEMKEPGKMREAYDVFFEHFKNHPRTVLELMRFAEEAFRENELIRALGYYRRVVADHEGKPAYFDALNRMTHVFSRLGQHEDEVRAINLLIRKLEESGEKGHRMINAMYRFATALRSMGPKFTDPAIAKFKEIEDLLKTPAGRAPYQKNEEETASNLGILQGAMFFGAMADAMRTEVPARVHAAFNQRAGREVPAATILTSFYKAGAVRRLMELVDLFPDSGFAPQALSQAGTLNTVMGKADEARLALQRLQRDYPKSPEAANAVFMIGRNLLEMGMRREALAYFKQMFSGEGEFNAGQILTAGRELLAAGEYAIAIEAFDRVIQSGTERNLLEPARVGKGQALVRLERYKEATEVFEKMLADYPNTGHTVAVCKGISQAHAAVASQTPDADERFDLFNRAVNAMNRARRFATEDGLRTELDVGVARIFERKTEAERTFGTAEKAAEYRNDAVAAYQAVIMFRNANDPAVAPHLQDAFARCLPLMLEMERWDDVVEDAQHYLRQFPNGRYVLDVRQALNRARVGGGTARDAEQEPGTQETGAEFDF